MKKLALMFVIIFLSNVIAEGPGIGDWWGSAAIDGTKNQYGAVIDAYINRTKVASDVVGTPNLGYYLIHVPGANGDKVLLKVCGINASTENWEQDRNEVNLSVSKLANGITCEYDCGCAGGYCCRGICSSFSCVSYPLKGDDSGGGGGGGGGTISNVESDNIFICDAWEECINGSQIRICKESNGNLPDRIETRACNSDFVSLSSSSSNFPESNLEKISSTNLITGAVSGVRNFARTTEGKSVLVVSGLIIISGASIIVVRLIKLKIR